MIAAAGPAKVKIRDAERSREAILDAAERLFAERGYDGVSLSEVGAESGLSRATPTYFFGSKEQLYRAVLERVSAERQAATAEAVAPLRDWANEGGDLNALQSALQAALGDYMGFLLSRPAFSRFIAWEEMAGGRRLRAARRDSTALTDAFAAIRKVGRTRGLNSFDVDDAVLLWVSLSYAPIANRNTLMIALNRDLTDAKVRRQHVRFAADQLMHLLAG